MPLIEPSRHPATLQRYLPLFIEQAAAHAESSLAARRRVLRQAAAINPDRVSSVPCSLFPVPYAFELWIAHLGWLDRTASTVHFTLDDLTAEESRGLAMLRAERDKFWQAHSTCPSCHSINPRTATFCSACATEFK